MALGNTSDLIAKAREHLLSGRLAEARALYARVCELDGVDAEAWLMLGTLQCATGDVEAALCSLGRSLELAPGNGRAHLALGKVHLTAGQEGEALAACEQALTCDTELAEAWLLQGIAQSWLDRHAAAEASARQLLALRPGSLDGRLLLANALRSQGRLVLTEAKSPLARPILVTGVPRSGTSLVAGCLHACGAWVGNTLAGNASNPEGYFENGSLREGILKPHLRQSGGDPLGVRQLPRLSALAVQPLLGGQVLQDLYRQGYEGEAPWLYKDAKLTLLWPVWRAAFPHACWVIVRRRAEDIVESCLRTDFMNQHSRDPAFWHVWVEAYLQRLEILKASGAWWREFEPQRLVAGGTGELRGLAESLGLEWNAAGVGELIKPLHWHVPAVAETGARLREVAAASYPPVMANSIPKSGTHLLGKALSLLGVSETPMRLYNNVTKPTMQTDETSFKVPVGSIWPCLVPIERLGEILLQVEPKSFVQGHLPYAERVASLIESFGFQMVLIIRDPRAVAVSHASWVPTREFLASHEFYRGKTADECLALAITGYRVEPEGPVELGLRRRFEQLLPWMAHPKVYTTRFEWLAGPKGGGDREVQLRELRNIAVHVGLSVREERLKQVAEGLYGGTMTFKEGRIDRWREEFKEQHTSLIKAEMGDLIVHLGYESDDNW